MTPVTQQLINRPVQTLLFVIRARIVLYYHNSACVIAYCYYFTFGAYIIREYIQRQICIILCVHEIKHATRRTSRHSSREGPRKS